MGLRLARQTLDRSAPEVALFVWTKNHAESKTQNLATGLRIDADVDIYKLDVRSDLSVHKTFQPTPTIRSRTKLGPTLRFECPLPPCGSLQ